MYFYDMGEFQIVGASPEILVRHEHVPEGEKVTIRPLAGTRPRGATPEDDKRVEAELLADPKERAEHLMLIDLARNDIGRIARTGRVKVTEAFAVERYSHVMHIVSNVEGLLKDGMSNLDVLRATFPAGTLTGAPKIRAMEIIDELEPVQARHLRRRLRLPQLRRRHGRRHRDPHRHRQGPARSTCRPPPASWPTRCRSWNGRKPRRRRARCSAPPSWSRRASEMLLMIDNYDSFTYNLVQYFGELGQEVKVVRNDELDARADRGAASRAAGAFARPLLAQRGRHLRAGDPRTSPASCRSSACAWATRASARRSAATSCAPQVQMHGKTSVISTDQQGVYTGLPREFTVIRYHSLAIERETLPAELEITSTSEDGEIMGVRHRSLPIEGVQFHPESILTEHGHAMLKNFLDHTH